MCVQTTTKCQCPTCAKHIREMVTEQWCKEARRKRAYGRCAMGVRLVNNDFCDEECAECAVKREVQLDKQTSNMSMEDFAKPGLGIPRHLRLDRQDDDDEEDDDDGINYSW